jgi:L-ribulose-5-phosphate 3-epimerase
MIKSINVWSFKDSNDVKGNVALAKKAGFEAIELALTPEEGPLTWSSTSAEVREVRKIVEDGGLKMASLAIGTGWQYPLSSPDAKIVQTGSDSIRKGLEVARDLGTDGVLVVPGSTTPEVSYEDVHQRTKDALAKLIDDAAKAEVAICVENVWNRYHLSPIELRDYVDSFDSEWMKVYLDVGNMLLYGFPEQWIRILGSRIKKVHFKDFSTSIGNGNGFVGLLSGDVNWPEVMKAFEEIGYDGPASVEIGPYKYHWEASIHVISLQMDYILGRRNG